MSDLLSNIGTFISSAVQWMINFVLQLTPGARNFEEPNWVLVMFVVILPLCGLGIGILRRIIKTRG